MKITLEQVGGFAGIRRRFILDTAELGEARGEVEGLARTVKTQRPAAGAPHPDAMVYLLTIAADDGTRNAAALALAHVAAWLPDDTRAALIEQLGELSPDAGVDAEEREARSLTLSALARTRPELVLATHASVTLNGLVRASKDDGINSRVAAARGLARIACASARIARWTSSLPQRRATGSTSSP